MTGGTTIEWSPTRARPVPGFPGYYVMDDGTMRGPARKVMNPMTASSGHRYIIARGWWDGGIDHKKLWVHHAVLFAFVGPRPEGMESRHLNGESGDNRIANLAWGTRRENADDTKKHGRLRAFRQAHGKLTAEKVADIRRRNAAHDGRLGESIRSLAREYGVSHTTVRKIVIGEKWA